MFSSYNSALVAKSREPEDKQLCITVQIVQNRYDTNPLDN